jgi:hypothetical protein
LKDINDVYGPNGTDQVRVIFYEADGSTGQDDLSGTGPATQGDWLTGVNYPIINESPVTLNGAKFWPLGFPTINVINPINGIIEADLYDTWAANGFEASASLPAMIDLIDNFITSGPVSSLNELNSTKLSVFPNPSNGNVTISMNSVDASYAKIEVSNLLGQIVFTTNNHLVSGNNDIQLDLSCLKTGQYIIRISNEAESITRSVQIK